MVIFSIFIRAVQLIVNLFHRLNFCLTINRIQILFLTDLDKCIDIQKNNSDNSKMATEKK